MENSELSKTEMSIKLWKTVMKSQRGFATDNKALFKIGFLRRRVPDTRWLLFSTVLSIALKENGS